MKSLILSILGGLLIHNSAHGALLIYRFSGIASGSTDSNSFINSEFNIQVLADTNNIISYEPIFSLDATSAAIDIVGVGSGTFTQAGRVFAYPGAGVVGFSAAGLRGIDILDLENREALSLYDLSSEWPTTPASNFYTGSSPYGSSLGDIRLTWVGNLTFTATAVPEPSATLAAGLAWAGLMSCRRRRPCAGSGAGVVVYESEGRRARPGMKSGRPFWIYAVCVKITLSCLVSGLAETFRRCLLMENR